MKVIALTAVLMGAMNAHKLHGDDVYELKGGWQRHLNGDPDFNEWFDVPHDKISVDDEHWGHEVQRVPKGDWLDGHATLFPVFCRQAGTLARIMTIKYWNS